MPYRILALDLDGTLTNDDKNITPNTFDALIRLQERGIRIVLASGRPVYGIMPLVEQLRLKTFGGFVLAFNGGKIIDCASQQIIAEQALPADQIPGIIAAAKAGRHAILSYKNEEIITETPDNPYVLEEARINKMNVRRVENFMEALPDIVDKCLIVDDPARLEPTEQALAAQTRGSLSVYRSAPFFLEVVPTGIDKAASLRRLLQQIGIEPAEMVAIGDGYNDLTMLELAGMGVAMANAQAPVKAAAQYVTRADNNHDGVAEAIAHLFTA